MFAESIKTNLPTELLRTLVTVCEFRSVTKAAQLLQLTQPAVLQQIRKLEIIIGSDIIDRKLAGINLTETGSEILKSAQRLLSINDKIILECGSQTGLQIVRLGVPNLFAKSVLPKIVEEIRQKAPRAQLQICCDNSPNVLRMLRLGYLDIAFAYGEAQDMADAMGSWVEEIGWVRASSFAASPDEPVPLISSPNVLRVDQTARYIETTGGLLNRLGIGQAVLIRGLPICEFSFGFTRVSSSPIYHREFNGRSVPMPVRLNAFPELPNSNGKRPVYVTQQKNEALYFKLDERRVRRWLGANGVPGVPHGQTIGAAYLEAYSDFGAFLDEFKEREGRGGAARSLCAYIYLLLHSLSHQVMHALADVSGLDRDGLGEHIFPADLAFVVYRKGMTPDLGNISAMWRNHSENFLHRLLDQRMLRCGSGSLCDTRGGACPACIMVSEVTCIGGNQLLSRSSLKGGPAPNWEPQGSSPLIGFFDPAITHD